MTRSCSQCGSNGHNSRTCDKSSAVGGVGRGGGIGGGGGSGEIMLFGFRVKVDPLRKTVSMNDLCNYEQPPTNVGNESTEKAVVDDADAGGGYVTADDALQHQNTGGRERKRGTPWTEEEHRLFLLGLQKVGKGDWRGISRKFVKSRTPTQVASHAQKYFIRKNNLNRRRRRSSLFDITTESVTDESMDEGQVRIREETLAKKPVMPSTLIANDTKDYVQNHVPVVPVAPVFLPVVQAHYSMNGMMNNYQGNYHLPSPSSMMYYSLPYSSGGVVQTEPEMNMDQEVGCESAPVCLSLSLSTDPYGQSSMRQSTLRTNNLNDGNSTITVA